LIYHRGNDRQGSHRQAQGCRFKSLNRIHGSHHILTKGGQAVPVPVHGTRDIGVGLRAAI